MCGDQKLLTAKERERKGEREDGLRKKKNNLLNEKEFDRSVFSKTDKLNLSRKLTVATSGFAGISGAEQENSTMQEVLGPQQAQRRQRQRKYQVWGTNETRKSI